MNGSGSVQVHLEPRLYPAEAVSRAIEAYRSIATIRPVEMKPDHVVINADGHDRDRVVDEFLNYALIASLELLLGRF